MVSQYTDTDEWPGRHWSERELHEIAHGALWTAGKSGAAAVQQLERAHRHCALQGDRLDAMKRPRSGATKAAVAREGHVYRVLHAGRVGVKAIVDPSAAQAMRDAQLAGLSGGRLRAAIAAGGGAR